MVNLFTKHPEEVNETYCQHFRFAWCFGWRMALAGLACVIHGIFPFMFQKTATSVVKELSEDCKKNRRIQ